MIFKGEGEEVAIVSNITGSKAEALKEGDIVCKIDPKYFRPAEVDTLLGDSSLARDELKWIPEITVKEMCFEMMENDYMNSKNELLVEKQGLK